MSTTPICDSQKYTVVKKDDGTLECVIPLHVGMKLETELAAAREALREWLPSLASEWAWKRNSTEANNREMAELDAAIHAAKDGKL